MPDLAPIAIIAIVIGVLGVIAVVSSLVTGDPEHDPFELDEDDLDDESD